MGGDLRQVIHHPEYYLDDGTVSFLTQGILFRVHKTFFQRESEVFRDLFESTADDVSLPGTDACPFTLDVTPSDFAQFLWVWYDREYAHRQQSTENWQTILRLAMRWHFDNIRDLAFREIKRLLLERMSIDNDLDMDGEQPVSPCSENRRSSNVPTQDEARIMEMDTLIKAPQAREDVQRKAIRMGHGIPTHALEDATRDEIITKFSEKETSTGLGGSSTIVMEESQDSDRRATTVGQQSSHLINHDRMGRQEDQGVRTESNNERKEGSQMEGGSSKKLEEDAEKETSEKVKGRAEIKRVEQDTSEKKKPDNLSLFVISFLLAFLFWHARTLRYAFTSFL